MDQNTIKTGNYQNEPCIEIKGSCDQRFLDTLTKAFQTSQPKIDKKLFLRLSDLSYMDSAALGVIMFNFHKLKQDNFNLVILDPSMEMKRLLKNTSLDKIISVEFL